MSRRTTLYRKRYLRLAVGNSSAERAHSVLNMIVTQHGNATDENGNRCSAPIDHEKAQRLAQKVVS